MTSSFTYAEFITRNFGFVDEAEQQQLHEARVYVCGTGGMGGACVEALVRVGVGSMVLADIDEFEVSNLNRQLAATMHTIGQSKVTATAERCLSINPQLKLDVLDSEWPETLVEQLTNCDLIINGTDDLGASLLIYRTARALGKTVVDAYAAPLPSVYVTQAGRPMPEERLGYPTVNIAWDQLTNQHRDAALFAELVWVLVHSSSRHHVDHALAAEMASGARSRMSFAPMVISAGMLMAFEAIAVLLDRSTATDERGWFLNPWNARVERPRTAVVSAIMTPLARRFLTRQLAD